ncbi:MAG: hypothetical protein K2X54_09465 [Methylobacterium organophilum]|nr:hypothetical protein [Methylobacterium organophilum]
MFGFPRTADDHDDEDDVGAHDVLRSEEIPDGLESPQARAARSRREAARRARESRERARLAAEADRAVVDALYRVSWDIRCRHAVHGRTVLDPSIQVSLITKQAFRLLVERGYDRHVAGESIKRRLARRS